MTESQHGSDPHGRGLTGGDGSQAVQGTNRAPPTDEPGSDPHGTEREFGLRGWILVGIVFLSFVVVPLLILSYPPGNFPYRVAFLLLPLAPALLLGLAAVWATTRP